MAMQMVGETGAGDISEIKTDIETLGRERTPQNSERSVDQLHQMAPFAR